MFNRTDYYSQLELIKLYRGKLSLSKIKEMIVANGIALHQRPVEIGYDRGDNFTVTARYILKTDWHKIVD
jgi:hypothetical protein